MIRASIPKESVRRFDTGATRNPDAGKLDFDGFLSPLVLERYAEYMHRHRTQADGTLRESDNWQKGIPLAAYMKSGWRHFRDWWREHRGYSTDEGIEEALCALIFNASGYLHETIKARTIDTSAERVHETPKSAHDAAFDANVDWQRQLDDLPNLGTTIPISGTAGYLADFGPNVADSQHLSTSAADTQQFPPPNCDGLSVHVVVGPTTNVVDSTRHPMAAEALRQWDERDASGV